MIRNTILRYFCLQKQQKLIYKDIYTQIEHYQPSQLLSQIYYLQKNSLMDQDIWNKAENGFFKWAHRLNERELTYFGIVMKRSQEFLSQRAKAVLEHRLRLIKLDDSNIPLIIQYTFPFASDNFKQHIILKIQKINYNDKLRCLITILETSTTLQQFIIQQLEDIQVQKIPAEMLTHYFILFFTNKIDKWLDSLKAKQQIFNSINGIKDEIIYHVKRPTISYFIQEFEEQRNQLQELQLLMIYFQILRYSNENNLDFKFKDEIIELIQSQLNNITPKEIYNFLIATKTFADINKIVAILKEYIQTHDIDENEVLISLIQIVPEDNEIVQIISNRIKFTLESLPVDMLLRLKKLNIQQLDTKIDELFMTYLRITEKIPINVALEFQDNLNIGNHQTIQLWEKVEIQNSQEVLQIISGIQKLRNPQKLIISGVLRKRFQLK